MALLSVVLLAATAADVLIASADSLVWSTLHVSPVELPVVRPEGTVRTVFKAVNLAGDVTASEEVPFGAESVTWTPFAGDAPSVDEFYTLTLSHYAADAHELFSKETAHIAVVRGAFGEGIDVWTSTDAPGWNELGIQCVVATNDGWMAQRFQFPPCRVDRPQTLTAEIGGTNLVSQPLYFKTSGYFIYAR